MKKIKIVLLWLVLLITLSGCFLPPFPGGGRGSGPFPGGGRGGGHHGR